MSTDEPTLQNLVKELEQAAEQLRSGDLDSAAAADLIERHAEGWTLDRIAPLERNILRVALHELIHRTDIPDEVAIDEAVEAAKELCSAEAPAFVNGILGSVQRDRAAPA